MTDGFKFPAREALSDLDRLPLDSAQCKALAEMWFSDVDRFVSVRAHFSPMDGN